MDKPLDRLYLEVISDLADAVAHMRRLSGQRHSTIINDFELMVDGHMRRYDRWLEMQGS